jgi:N-acetylmuramoyl-L-alanine amidase
MRELVRILPITAIGLLAAGFIASPVLAQTASVTRVEIDAVEGRTRLALETDRPAAARVFFLSDPNRFVVDLAGARWPRAGEAEGAGLARRRRYANRPGGTARLVLDLEGPARLALRRAELGGRRLVFDLADAGPALLGARRVVVVDPGHGGRDPGAVGVSGVQEKDVALAAARLLRAALEARGYEVAMTREADEFIELADRVRFARARRADLFISLHADSSPGADAHGAAVYRLSEGGAARSRAIMDEQNWGMDFGDAPRTVDVRDILVDLTQRETANRSAGFAQTVIARLDAAGVPVLHRIARNAGFFVLLAPDVPAVLVEMGFLTHVHDETRLANPDEQLRLAAALAEAADSFLRQ